MSAVAVPPAPPAPSASQRLHVWLPREPASALTHLAGLIGAVVALALLVTRATAADVPVHIFSLAVFGSALVLTYGASVLYHWARLPSPVVGRLLVLDRTMIFFLISATYLPVCLGPLSGPWGWSVLGTVCGLSVLGIVVHAKWPHAPDWVPTLIYAGIGCVVVTAAVPMFQHVGPWGLSWLAGGGISYLLGAVVLILGRPRPARWFGAHDVFHVFVLGGSVCHVIFMDVHLIA